MALDREVRRDERNERILCTKMFSVNGVDDGEVGKRPHDSVDDEFFEDMSLRLQGEKYRDLSIRPQFYGSKATY